jgi:hypothetical protein
MDIGVGAIINSGNESCVKVANKSNPTQYPFVVTLIYVTILKFYLLIEWTCVFRFVLTLTG